MSCGRGVSGYLTSECSACLTDAEFQGRCRQEEGCQGICLLNAARLLQTQSVKVDVVRMSSVRAFAFWTQRVSYRRRVSRQMLSGRSVSGHLPSECSTCLTDAECQGRCRPDEGCQGIGLLNAARVLQTQTVKANVFQTIHGAASAFQTRSVRAFAFWT